MIFNNFIAFVILFLFLSCKAKNEVAGIYKNPPNGTWVRYFDYHLNNLTYPEFNKLIIYPDSTFKLSNPCYEIDSGKYTIINNCKLVCVIKYRIYKNDSLDNKFKSGIYHPKTDSIIYFIKNQQLTTEKHPYYTVRNGELFRVKNKFSIDKFIKE